MHTNVPFELSQRRREAVESILAIEKCDTRSWDRPVFKPGNGNGTAILAVETFARHMTNEGWQLQKGLENAGYTLFGKFFPNEETDALRIIEKNNPAIVVVQDKREWDASQAGCFDKRVQFLHVPALAEHPEIFRVTVLKDLLFNRNHTMTGHNELRPHAVIHYYHEYLVRWLAPWLENTPLIRTYHSIDPEAVPEWISGSDRRICLVSGAMNKQVYPLRSAVEKEARRGQITNIKCLTHPGYNANGSQTDEYLKTLMRYKVAICCSSIMGFLLRKIIEATACGCVVITDLPRADFPEVIADNLVYVESDTTPARVDALAASLANSWDEEKQKEFAKKAIEFFDYKKLYLQLAFDIDRCKRSYGTHPPENPAKES